MPVASENAAGAASATAGSTSNCFGACGDWLYHGFAEYAWLSGHILGAAIAAEAPR